MMKRFEPMPGETVITRKTIHWKNYAGPAVRIALLAALLYLRLGHPGYSLVNVLLGKPAVLPDAQARINIAETALILILMLEAFVRMMEVRYTEYLFTNIRIISISGIIGRKFEEIFLEKVEMVNLSQNLFERLVNSGDIDCISAGSRLRLEDVWEAMQFKQEIMSYITINKMPNNTT